MNFSIMPNEKFACITFKNLSHILPNRYINEYSNSKIWITTYPPPFLKLDELWEEWLGSIIANDISESNFWIILKDISKNPEIINEENQILEYKVLKFWHTILLFGFPKYETAYILSGSYNQNINKTQIRTIKSLFPMYGTFIEPPKIYMISENDLEKTAKLYQKVIFIFDSKNNNKYERLRHCFNIYLKGLCEWHKLEKIHSFARSCEGLIYTNKGKSTSQFKHRLKYLCKDPNKAEKVLEEAYNIRGFVEHINLNELKNKDPNLIDLRVSQMEDFCRWMLREIFLDPDLLSYYECDKGVEGLWQKKDDEIKNIWKNKFDLK